MALNGVRGDVRTKETNLGNLIADAMLEGPAGRRAGGVMNGGGVRASIDAGQITLGELLDVQPFDNKLSLVTLTGAQLKEALENGVSQIETVAGRFARVSNMRYSFDPGGRSAIASPACRSATARAATLRSTRPAATASRRSASC